MKAVHTILLTAAILLQSYAITAAELGFGAVQIDGDTLKVSLSIEDYQRSEIIEAIKRGMEVKILYSIQIVKESPVFLMRDSVIAEKNISRRVKYDFWNKSFRVREGKKSTTFQSENSMLEYFFTISGCELASVNVLRKARYTLRARAELKSVELYFPMNLIFKYLVGFWDFSTGWKDGPPLNLE